MEAGSHQRRTYSRRHDQRCAEPAISKTMRASESGEDASPAAHHLQPSGPHLPYRSMTILLLPYRRPLRHLVRRPPPGSPASQLQPTPLASWPSPALSHPTPCLLSSSSLSPSSPSLSPSHLLSPTRRRCRPLHLPTPLQLPQDTT
uniref:Uncharacterized protein n=1 Tax=Triticum urartu TaxID=4572 RepID=A0A8R7QRQ4_TRIUA